MSQDHYHSVGAQKDGDADRLKYAQQLISQSNFMNCNEPFLSITKLEKIAKARYGLGQVAEWIHLLYFEGGDVLDKMLANDIRRLSDFASDLCTGTLKWPRFVSVKRINNL